MDERHVRRVSPRRRHVGSVLHVPMAFRMPIEPELDLHAFRPADIPSLVDEYLRAAAREGITLVRLVHGRGRGVQRLIVQKTLDRHPLVEEFWDDHDSHLGATMARLAVQVG